MAEAIRAKNHPWKGKIEKHRKREKGLRSSVQDKTWAELSAEDKDALLKILCLRFNLIKPDVADEDTPEPGRGRDRRDR